MVVEDCGDNGGDGGYCGDGGYSVDVCVGSM